jgi:hypothetical protein
LWIYFPGFTKQWDPLGPNYGSVSSEILLDPYKEIVEEKFEILSIFMTYLDYFQLYGWQEIKKTAQKPLKNPPKKPTKNTFLVFNSCFSWRKKKYKLSLGKWYLFNEQLGPKLWFIYKKYPSRLCTKLNRDAYFSKKRYRYSFIVETLGERGQFAPRYILDTKKP